MHARLPFAAGVAMWMAAVSAAVAPLRAADEQRPQFTHHTSFGLSFSFKQPPRGKDDPREVHLHVSRDHGATWSLADRAEPSQKKFLFKSSGDAEYWFMLRTKFASGGYLPAGPAVPELKVVVDTAPPQMVLQVSEGEDGEVYVRWHLSDAHLASESFKVEYQYKRSGIGGDWQRVAVDPLQLEPGQTQYNGGTTIVPFAQGQAGAVVVRAEIADLAGNHTVEEKPLDWAKPQSQSVAAGRRSQRPRATADRNAARTDRWEPESASGSPISPPASADDPPPEMPDAFGGPAMGQREPRNRRPDSADERAAGRTRPNTDGGLSRRSAPTAEPYHPPIAGQRGPREMNGEPEEPGTMPNGAAAAHMVNKERFELVYDVDAVGSAGVAQIELWVTEDAGKSWQAFGIDDDCRSPMTVNVDGEGLYGFRVVVRTTTGASSPVPVGGDLPDVWVGVDLTKPSVKLLSAEQGSDDESDQLAIEWRAGDERLAGRPILLSHAETPDGPWTTIAAGLENSGRYLWRVDPRLPDRVYVQVEARDEAGNVAVDQLAEPVSLKQVRPQSRIRGVHPLGVRPRPERPLR